MSKDYKISRIRENGTKDFQAKDGKEIVNACRIIIHDKQYAKVNNVMIDYFTASAIVQVYENLNDKNREKMENMDVNRMAIVCLQLVGK